MMLATTESQLARLREMLPRWIKRVPLYRDAHYGDAMANGPLTLETLRHLPIITKAELRHKFPDNFLGLNPNLDSMVERNVVEVEHTSGTSEERTALLLPRGWWADQELKALALNPLTAKIMAQNPAARRVTINSPVCNNDISYVNLPTYEERIVGNALFVSLSRHPFLWSEDELSRMADEAAEWQPVFLDVDPVYGAIFALYCERNGIQLPTLRFILASYEYVSVLHRKILERVFKVPVFSLYGSTETGHLMMETSKDQLVPSTEIALLEIVEPDARGIGSVIATTLTNDYMPLIRYRVGDLAEISERPGGVEYILHGREKDAFRLPDGSRVTIRDVDECFGEINGVIHYQLLQGSGDGWQLRYVRDGAGPSEIELSALRERLEAQLKISGGLVLEPVELLLPEGSGKFCLGYPERAPL